MKQTTLLILLLLSLFSAEQIFARNLPVVVNDVTFTLGRDSSVPEQLPLLQAKNDSGQDQEFRLETRLVLPDGTEEYTASATWTVPAGETATLAVFADREPMLKGHISLAHTRIFGSQNARGEISGIFGTPAPVPQEKGGLFGINVHLNRYRASTRWRLLQMMKEAGITTVRVDSIFPAESNEEARKATIDRLRDDLLALEAFGMNSLVCIAYFNDDFYKSPEKQAIAYRWGKRMAEAVKGRTSFHFGNETNSGWGAYGAAADMSALNQAFALGVAAGDPAAWRGSLGIAEAPVRYVEAFCEAGAMNWLEAIAVHPYCGSPEAGMAKIAAVKGALQAKGIGCQIWATETGFHVDKGDGSFNVTTGELTGVTGFSQDMQAKLLPRLFVLGAAVGLQRIYWYDFFGRNDPETYWLVAPDYTPRPAYYALKNVSSELKDAVYIDGTPFSALVQRHVFQRSDGSRLLVCWATRENIPADFSVSKNSLITDWMGNAVSAPENGILVLGHGPFFINGISEKDLPSLYDGQILVSALDDRDFRKAAFQRFFASPGETIRVPLAVFNGHDIPVDVKPVLRRGIPGWTFAVPEAMTVQPSANAVAYIDVTIPEDAIPGVEYDFSVQGIVGNTRMTRYCDFRVELNGRFPYYEALHSNREPDYPMHDSLREAVAGTGNPMIEIQKGTVQIDACLDEWKAADFNPLDQKFYGALRDTGKIADDDWKGKVALRWDETMLYAAVIVHDDQLCFPDFISRDWRDNDNMRLLVSAVENQADRAKNNLTKKDILVITTPTNLEHTGKPCVAVAALGGFQRPGAETRIRTASKIWKNGYVMEIAIPFDLIGLAPASGMVIGLNVMADDTDDMHRQSVAMTRCQAFNYWRVPAATGNAILK